MNLGVIETKMITNDSITQKRFSYGLNEISELTGLSTAFLRKLARAGTLKTKKFGARRMVLDADLQEFLKGENDETK
jgi:hypothetical protein